MDVKTSVLNLPPSYPPHQIILSRTLVYTFSHFSFQTHLDVRLLIENILPNLKSYYSTKLLATWRTGAGIYLYTSVSKLFSSLHTNPVQSAN